MTASEAQRAQAPDPGVIVRDAADADLPAIQAIYAHHVLNGLGSFEETAPDVAEMTRRRATFLAKGLPYLVAEIDGEVVGFAYGAPYRTRAAYRHTVEDSIYVSPSAPRRGIGRALLSALIQRCTGVLREVGWKFGGWVDCVLMQLALDGGPDSGQKRRAAKSAAQV